MRHAGAAPATARSVADLLHAGVLDPRCAPTLGAVADRYAVAVSPAMLSLINADDANDPIARQFVPSDAELVRAPEDMADPIGDARHSPVDGIVHRYPDRVLLKLLPPANSASLFWCAECVSAQLFC